MKLARYTYKSKTSIGKIEGDRVIDLHVTDAWLPDDLTTLLSSPEALGRARQLTVEQAGSVALSEVRLEAPIIHPGKFLALGMNYKDHEAEARRHGVPIPPSQVWFNKQVSCINGPFDDVHHPDVCEKLDYEAELGVVIGKAGRYISEDDALAHVGGYFVANDVTARDWQAKSPTWTLGKSFDTHGPIGPWVVTADEIPDPQDLHIWTVVDGHRVQDASTGQMVRPVSTLIAHLSRSLTLRPGTLISTGSPGGAGYSRDPQIFPRDRSTVTVGIDGIGELTTHCRILD